MRILNNQKSLFESFQENLKEASREEEIAKLEKEREDILDDVVTNGYWGYQDDLAGIDMEIEEIKQKEDDSKDKEKVETVNPTVESSKMSISIKKPKTPEKQAENGKIKGDSINEEDTIVRVVTSQQQEKDYCITDITELNKVSDGDVQPPIDISELLVETNERLEESVGKNWGAIHIQSSRYSKETYDSNALFELNVGDKSYLMSMLLEENAQVLKVNNTKGQTIFKRKSDNVSDLVESYIKQFIPMNEEDKTVCDEKPLKEKLEKVIAKSPDLTAIYENIKLMLDVAKELKDDVQYNKLVQTKLYAFVAELSSSVQPCMPTDKDELNISNYDNFVEELFGSEYVKVDEVEPKQLKGTETLTEDDNVATEEPEVEAPKGDTPEEPKNGLATGYASFVRKPKNIEDLEDKSKYFTDGDASYVVVERKNVTQDEFNDITEDFLKVQEFCKAFEPIDVENYAYNVVQLVPEGLDYTLLIDPAGYDYCRYVAKVSK